MPPGKLDTSVLITLGLLASGCGEKDDDDTAAGPCLDYAADSGDTAVGPCLGATDTGPCLEYVTDTGPCLDIPTDTGTDDTGTDDTGTDDTGAGSGGEERATVVQRVLESGILPDDVVKLLSKKMGS